MKRAGILYISYDGMLEPLGQSQVLSYLERLSADWPIHVMSFEKKQDWTNSALRSSVQRRIDDAAITWHPLRYHKSPSAPATAYDITIGTLAAISTARKHKLKIVHARSYVAGLIGMGVKKVTGAKLIFDMRGLWADERVEAGLWPAGGRLYRAAKALERKLLLAADDVVTLTNAAAEEISGFPYMRKSSPPIDVIPTCVDLDRFTLEQGEPHPFTLGYVGSVGTWYLLDQMLQAFVYLRDRVAGSRLLLVNRGDHDFIRERAAAQGIAGEELELVEASHLEMPRLISRMSAGMALYKSGYSRVACSPTKVGEYLACGVPCLASAAVGDLKEILEASGVGVALTGYSDAEMMSAVERIVSLAKEEGIKERCRKAAAHFYSLSDGVSSYGRIYTRLSKSTPGPRP